MLGLLLGIGLVNNHDHLRSALEILYHLVDIEAYHNEAVDNHQTGNGNTYRRKGHEAVLEGGFYTLSQEIKEISLSLHSCNTHPFRH